jgi:DNA-binding ferritin-like protein
MNMPTLRKGNSEARPPMLHHDASQQANRHRELHPAAAEAVARYSAVWDENEKLIAETTKLRSDNEMLHRVDAEKTALISDLRRCLEDSARAADERVARVELHLRERLADAERSKERYLRYAVAIAERLKACGDQITEAHNSAMEMANTTPMDSAEHKIDEEMRKLLDEQKAAKTNQE